MIDMSLIRYQKPETNWSVAPLRQIFNLRGDINQVFDRMFQFPFDLTRDNQFMGGWVPAIDLYENKDVLTVKAELPGMKKSDIEVSLHDNLLTISGERKQESKEQSSEYRTERFVGRFQRTFTLPTQVNAEKITAAYEDGVLTVVMPKAEAVKPKLIPVTVK